MVEFNEVAKKWQKKWQEKNIFKVVEDSKKPKFYCLEMFPYPSGYGLHMGHVRNYSIGDTYARYKRMQGFNVLYPMGYDAFGLPAENAAIKEKTHPKIYTEKAISIIKQQQKELGLSYDWSRELATCYPEYYKWNQYFFLKFLEKGLAYRKEAPINWCPGCKTVLANEQVEQGKCWRCESNVEIKPLEQWFFRITKYADELLDCIDDLEWPEKIKTMQKNWIGKIEGTEILFEIKTEANFVLLHGYTGSPDANFFPWSKRELDNKGYKVNIPKLPNTDNPDLIEQVRYVLDNCKFDEKTVLLGHSLGSVVALKVLEQLKTPIKKLVLAAGFSEPKFKDKQRPFEKTFDWKFDFNKIKNNVKEVIILRAENDSKVPAERADELEEQIGGKIIDFVAEGDHIGGKQEPEVLNSCLEKWPVFTTRSDTLYGVTFMVFAPEHPKVQELVKGTPYEKKVNDFIKKVVIEDKFTRMDESKEKEGIFIGRHAINPLTNEEIPIYIANFVLMEYGTGLIMAVPAHDQRDFEFAKKYEIPLKIVITPEDRELLEELMEKAYVDEGILVNSGKFNGLKNLEAIEKINDYLEEKKVGKRTIQYKLRDWLISRQRYWGTPIPVVYCDKCGVVPLRYEDLPVLLPEDIEFTGEGNPLLKSEEFLNVKCPKCNGKARRETDTMDTFVDSCWYFLRYCSPKEEEKPFDEKAIKYWMPVDQYIGGAEHAVMHLLYARFFTKVLRDLGMLDFDEPFTRLFNQGTVIKDGAKMSKSYGNVVSQDEIANKYGIDTARLFLLFVASPGKELEWSDQGIEGSFRFLKKVVSLIENNSEHFSYSYKGNEKLTSKDRFIISKTHKTIKNVTENIENFEFNLAIISIMEFVNELNKYEEKNKEVFTFAIKNLLLLLSPFTPHICEELWEKVGMRTFVSLEKWPHYDETKIDLEAEAAEEFVSNTIADINSVLQLTKIQNPKKITLIVSEQWKYDFFKILKDLMEETREEGELIKRIASRVEFKRYGGEIAKLIPKLVKNASKIPSLVLKQEKEIEALEEARKQIEQEFKAEIEIIRAEDSQEAKAKNAMPGKVAILVS